MALTDYAANALLNSLFGKTSTFGALASAPTVYVGLSAANPGASGAGLAEPSGENYARVAAAAGVWNAAGSAAISNGSDITFPTATSPGPGWGTITHVVLMDASSGGNVLAYAALGAPIAVAASDTPRLLGGTPGELVLARS